MKTTTASHLRTNLATTLDRVADDHEPVVVTREGGKPAVVLISLEDYASLEETRHLLRSPANASRLLASVRDLEAGQGVERQIEE
ncbi:type II toxin-antitoxin system prevent-host-death family antitoxin [Alsobacter soli]|uniref:Antitoxin n=1 Tax=Alsobacter soli TaxID=2109933 RepID=A0A2T1HMR8_9HYPH|nr:type II toxin-antitoxin system prevent-host-death family antitoxin [Alsobacter soli]PSC02960.1 type II toxin-antitoxin system prevent-host-death family antitoxin [Alsobacter soli]